jgi:hypothetical protein
MVHPVFRIGGVAQWRSVRSPCANEIAQHPTRYRAVAPGARAESV